MLLITWDTETSHCTTVEYKIFPHGLSKSAIPLGIFHNVKLNAKKYFTILMVQKISNRVRKSRVCFA